MAHLWHLDADKAMEIIVSILKNMKASLTRKQLIETLEFLSFAQLQQIVDC